jgi:hypothetical protein
VGRLTPRNIGHAVYLLGLAMLCASAVVLILSAVWGVLPWFGVGGQVFVTLWLGGIIVGALGALSS